MISITIFLFSLIFATCPLPNVVFHLIKRSYCEKYLKINVHNEEDMCIFEIVSIIWTTILPSISRSWYSIYMFFEHITVSKGKLAATKNIKIWHISKTWSLTFALLAKFQWWCIIIFNNKRKWFLCKFAEATILFI